MIGMVVIESRPRRRRWWNRRPKPPLRVVARAVAYLQIAEGMALHGERDRHIEAPGVRIQARTEDRWAEA